MHTPATQNQTAVRAWLCACLLLVACMVLVGGYTRLSGSGLSITEWKPVHGVVPPLDAVEWQEEFDAYRASPQYQKINRGMSLDEFKTIFWPEYWHRVLGRVVGFVFLVPLLFFAIGKHISKRFALRLFAIFALGGLQGLVGWLMVKSGLQDAPYVSHFKLALHLSIAFTLFGLLLWALLDIIKPSPREGEGWEGGESADHSLLTAPHLNPPPQGGRKYYFFWFSLLCLQIIFGSFVAGLHGGLLYNTYPDMNGSWIPPELWEEPVWHSPGWMQFIHRTLAAAVAFGFIIWWYLQRNYVKNKHLGKVAAGVALTIVFQFALGVATLLHHVPLNLALMHQMTALLLFGSAVILLYRLRTTVNDD